MNYEVLISLVEKYEELYNLKHQNYHNQQRRDNIWEEIGAIMKESGKACRDRWTKIRDNHRRALQLRKTKGGQAGTKMRPPKYYKELKFLVPYLKDDENQSLNILSTDPSIDHLTKIEQSSINSPLSSVTSPVASPQCDSLDSQSWGAKSSTRRARSRNSDKISNASVLKEYLKHRESIPNTLVTPNSILYSDEQDPLFGFFINMARTVKSFPIQEQIRIKSAIFSIVNNTELRLAMQSTTPETIISTFPEHPGQFIVTDLQMRQEASTAAQNTVMLSQPQSSNVPDPLD